MVHDYALPHTDGLRSWGGMSQVDADRCDRHYALQRRGLITKPLVNFINFVPSYYKSVHRVQRADLYSMALTMILVLQICT